MRLTKLVVFAILATLIWSASSTRAADKGKQDFDWLKKLATKATTDGSKPTTVAGVRGLEETGQDVDTTLRDYAALERIEKTVVTDRDVSAFVDEGGLK